MCWLGLVFVAGLLGAQPKPSSDLLLPYFEVDLEGGEATTVFAVVNSLDKQVDVAAALYTNWGLAAISTQIRLKPGEVLTADLRAWIVEGHLPGKSLTAGEMLRVQAMLSGQPSPADGLYHATDVALGRATGYLTLRTLRTGGKKGAKPDALRGEGFLVDPEQGPARGHDLVDIDKATTKEVCNRHNLRHLSGTGLAEARVVVWRDLAGQILPAPAPVDRGRQIDVWVYEPDGRLLRNQSFQLLPAEQVPVAELGLTEPLGRIEIATAEASVAVIQDSAGGPLFETSCVQTDNPGPGPGPKTAVQIETLVNGQRAISPPGPAVPIGSTVHWSYRVTNSGSEPLTQVSVRGEQGIAAACPKGTLNPGQSLTCTASTTAQACQQRNVGTVTARTRKGKKGGSTVTARDPGHYFGEDGAAIEIVTSTNGMDANVPTGPSVLAGSPVSWTYLVTNTGKLRLLAVRVSDDHGAAVACPSDSLDPGEAMTCEAAGVAAAGQFGNVATVTASTACGEISDSDPSHYFGESDKNVQLRALVNGFDADVAPGPSVPVGSPVTWEYVVTNSGKFPLNGLAVSDDKGTAVSCPKAGLTAGEAMTCIARGVASSCQNAAFASVTGQTPDGTQVAASNPAHYFGQAEASILIKTSINGNDADLPPGPSVPIGTTVQWIFTLTNTGKVALSDITVTDSRGTTATCPRTDLRPGETLACTATGTAISGDFSNLGKVTAKPPCGDPVRDDDPSHYKGVGDPGIRIRTLVLGQDANLPPGPTIPVGNPVSWSYVVTNTGQFPLSDVKVIDSYGAIVACPQKNLQPGQAVTCTSSATAAQACQFGNQGTASGQAPNGDLVMAVDPSYYTGSFSARVDIETAVDGNNADSPKGPNIEEGTSLDWTYKVTNLGNVALTNVRVVDDQGAPVECLFTSLAPLESKECKASGTAVEGQFRNVGTVTADPPCGAQVSAQDASHYFGTLFAAIDIETLTSGQPNAGTPADPVLLVGSAVQWTYVVRNAGKALLSEIAVSDSKGVAVTCPKTELKAGESMTCTASGTVLAVDYTNVGTATAQTPFGTLEEDSDTSHYLGKRPSLRIETTTNGKPDDSPAGASLIAGEPLAREYVITNSGDFDLINIHVTDFSALLVNCASKTTLAAGEVMTCTASSTAGCGPRPSTATVTGNISNQTATDDDPANYTGTQDAGISIETFVGTEDADAPSGPTFTAGDSITWNYKVKNTGKMALANVAVTDSKGVVPLCPKTVLQPAEEMTCPATGTAELGQYSSVGTVTATPTPTCGPSLADDDPVHYKGVPVPQTPTIVFGTTPNYQPVWNTEGTGATQTGSFHRPVPSAGFFILGDYWLASTDSTPSDDQPAEFVTVIRVDNENPSDPWLKAPADYTRIWDDNGTSNEGSIWKPEPPAGFTCFGHVVQTGLDKPTVDNSPGLDKYRCLRNDKVVNAVRGDLQWKNDGMGGTNVSVFRVSAKLKVIYAYDSWTPPAEALKVPMNLP
ncbi:MAG TPA: Vps62-related protein [Thermoanaerobaculia bacterium]|nr:Vps62-related protein [Thermoanaerobaculia bacterium]